MQVCRARARAVDVGQGQGSGRGRGLLDSRPETFSTSQPQLPKVVREWCVLYILTSKCTSRHNGVHFFDIAPRNFQKWSELRTPNLVCFVHFDCKMCFAPPQRRANFHLSSGQLAPHPPL